MRIIIRSILGIAISLSACLTAAADPFVVANSELKMIVTLFRHGARISSSDNLDLKEKKPNSGELSPVGQRQLYYLGQMLGKDYMEDTPLLSKKYDASQLYVRSTDVNRTIMSAQSLLAGLYPAKSGDAIDQTILANNPQLLNVDFQSNSKAQPTQITDDYPILNGYQPIPVHVVEKIRDKVLLGYGDTCPQEEIWNPENQKSEDWKRITQEFQPDIQKFATIFKLDASTLDLFTVYNYMDIIIAQQYESNNKLPIEYTSDQNLQKSMKALYNLRIHLSLYKTPLQKKATVTPFLTDLVANLDSKISNRNNNLKGYFLSAHDTTINMVLQGFNLTSWECIEKNYMKTLSADEVCITTPTQFGANFIVELRQDKTTSQNYIMVRYNGVYQKICDQKSIYCEIEDFKSRVKAFIIDDYDLVCGLKTAVSAEQKITSFSLLLSNSILFMIALLFI